MRTVSQGFTLKNQIVIAYPVQLASNVCIPLCVLHLVQMENIYMIVHVFFVHLEPIVLEVWPTTVLLVPIVLQVELQHALHAQLHVLLAHILLLPVQQHQTGYALLAQQVLIFLIQVGLQHALLAQLHVPLELFLLLAQQHQTEECALLALIRVLLALIKPHVHQHQTECAYLAH